MAGRGYPYSTPASADAASHGATPASLACSFPRPAKSKPADGCSSFIPTPARCAPRAMSKPRSKALRPVARQAGRSRRRRARHERHPGLSTSGSMRSPAVFPAAKPAPMTRSRPARASGAAHSVAQAIGRNPFMIIVPCHRVLEAGRYTDKISPNGGMISKRRLLSIEGADPPRARPCSTCCSRLPRRGRQLNFTT